MLFDAILFDMDGVLVYSEDVTAQAGVLTLREYGLEVQASEFAPFVGGGERRYLGGVTALHGMEYREEMKQRLYDHFGALVSQATLPEGVTALLHTLRGCGFRLAVCSSADRRKVEYNLQALGAEDGVFDAVLTGSDVSKPKPDPEIYLLGAKRLGVSPERCLVVEDAPAGIEAARAGGMRVAAVAGTFTKDVLMQTTDADHYLEKLDDLRKIIM